MQSQQMGISLILCIAPQDLLRHNLSKLPFTHHCTLRRRAQEGIWGWATQTAELSLGFFVLSLIQPLDALKAVINKSIKKKEGGKKVLYQHFWADEEAERKVNYCAAAVSLTDITAL